MQPMFAAGMPHRSPLYDGRYSRTRRSRSAGALGGIRPRVDTRSKILTPAAARALEAPHPLVVVEAAFDILRAEEIHELDEIRRRTGARCLLARVRNAPFTLLPLKSRAELAAALRVIDYVLPGESTDWSGIVSSLAPDEIISLVDAETRRARGLIEHVRQRQNS